MLDSAIGQLRNLASFLLVLVLPSFIQAKPVSPCKLSVAWGSSGGSSGDSSGDSPTVFSELNRLSNSSTHPSSLSTPSFLSKTLHLKCIALSSFQKISFELVSSMPNGGYTFSSPRSFAPVFKTHEYSSSVQVHLPIEDHHSHQDDTHKMTLLVHTLTHNGVSLTQAMTLSPLKQQTSSTASPSSSHPPHTPLLHKNVKTSRQPTQHTIRFSRGKMSTRTLGKP